MSSQRLNQNLEESEAFLKILVEALLLFFFKEFLHGGIGLPASFSFC